MTSSSRTTVAPVSGRHRARPAHSPMRRRLAAVAAASGLAAAGLTGVASAADLPNIFASSGSGSDAAGAASADAATAASVSAGSLTEGEGGAVTSANSTGNAMVDGLLNMVVGSIPKTDVIGSLVATVGSVGTGSLAAGSWEGLPLSSTLGEQLPQPGE
ncbi:MAG: hypothetical protein ACTIBZ_07095 [Corynebacterium variabile]|uniref:hypothetical protein n=1 Tax=Corynebacterium variabile TaxID=1727 RepID=UPI003F907E48